MGKKLYFHNKDLFCNLFSAEPGPVKIDPTLASIKERLKQRQEAKKVKLITCFQDFRIYEKKITKFSLFCFSTR